MNIWIYIITGIIVANLLAAINKESRHCWNSCWNSTVSGIYEKSKKSKNIVTKAAFLIFYLLIALILFGCLLLFVPVATIDIIFKKKHKYEPVKEVDTNLYFVRMGGSGTIHCCDCGYKEDIVSFIHGNYDASVGYQCQSCGKFHALHSHSEKYHTINIVDPLICSCSGQLSCEKPLFCPQCKSKSMKYDCGIMT